MGPAGPTPMLGGVTEPPKLYGPHVPTIVFQTFDSCTCKLDNSGSLSGILGETRIIHIL
jgi:hypothetical protein